jgi:hypothetical protein
MSDNNSTILQHHLERLRLGDLSARNELLANAYANLQRLARQMLARFPGVHRWQDTDDLNNAAA